MADARPNLVKGLLMAEAASSTFYELQFIGAPDWFKEIGFEKPYGVTRTPLSFEPAAPAAGLDVVQQEKADKSGLVRCWMQKEPARKLVNFKSIPVLLMVGEASFQAPAAHCNTYFLTQAGVQHDFIRLEDVGLHALGQERSPPGIGESAGDGRCDCRACARQSENTHRRNYSKRHSPRGGGGLQFRWQWTMVLSVGISHRQ
jgi:hypothetical protein